jgi:hypothetical protein
VPLASVVIVFGLFEAALSFPLQSQVSAPPRADNYPLSGVVVDEKKAPLVNAELTFLRDGRTIAVLRSSETGTFAFDSPFLGEIQVVARRLGYKARTTTLNLDVRPSTELLTIVLETVPSEVAALIVTASGGRLAQFYEHRKQYAFGRFMDREEIEKSNVRLASDLFRAVPGASLRASRRYGNTIRLRGCQPIVWIDKVPIRDVELDEVAVPEEIAGLEIYTSSMTVPAQYMDRGGRSCGAIVVWTRIN